MPAERFYINTVLNQGTTVSLEGAELHHFHVYRIRLGEEVELVNGRGALARAQLISERKQAAVLEILSVTQTPLPGPHLILAVPLMRPSKLEWVIEKCTELGADAIFLYPAHFSEKDRLSPHQLERLEQIAISALKQCGRLDLPEIKLLESFEDLFTMTATFLFGDTRETAKKILAAGDKLTVFITGPEKGFSPKELLLLEQKAIGVSLHRNILRAETAPIVALCRLFSPL